MTPICTSITNSRNALRSLEELQFAYSSVAKDLLLLGLLGPFRSIPALSLGSFNFGLFVPIEVQDLELGDTYHVSTSDEEHHTNRRADVGGQVQQREELSHDDEYSGVYHYSFQLGFEIIRQQITCLGY